MRISVIIPTLNEANQIERTLQAVRAQPGPTEIIVADGGSTDDTMERAQSHAQVIEAPRGRARQMNRGAEEASGEVYFFLHADSRPPEQGLAAIRDTLSNPRVEAGAFRLSFDRNTPLLRFYSWCTQWPWIYICFGDRGLFVRRHTFELIGGYPDWPIFEDLEMARRLHERGGFRFMTQAVTTSARRFERVGALRQQLRNARLWLHYVTGTDPESVAHLYPYESSSSDA